VLQRPYGSRELAGRHAQLAVEAPDALVLIVERGRGSRASHMKLPVLGPGPS
jgi:hypothetical protein